MRKGGRKKSKKMREKEDEREKGEKVSSSRKWLGREKRRRDQQVGEQVLQDLLLLLVGILFLSPHKEKKPKMKGKNEEMREDEI